MKFEINGKEYEGAKFNYNAYCNLSEMGIPIDRLIGDPLVGVRGYLAISGGMTVEQAGDELEQHLINDGDLSGISKVFSDELNKSGFFQKMVARMTAATEEKKPNRAARRKK